MGSMPSVGHHVWSWVIFALLMLAWTSTIVGFSAVLHKASVPQASRPADFYWSGAREPSELTRLPGNAGYRVAPGSTIDYEGGLSEPFAEISDTCDRGGAAFQAFNSLAFAALTLALFLRLMAMAGKPVGGPYTALTVEMYLAFWAIVFSLISVIVWGATCYQATKNVRDARVWPTGYVWVALGLPFSFLAGLMYCILLARGGVPLVEQELVGGEAGAYPEYAGGGGAGPTQSWGDWLYSLYGRGRGGAKRGGPWGADERQRQAHQGGWDLQKQRQRQQQQARYSISDRDWGYDFERAREPPDQERERERERERRDFDEPLPLERVPSYRARERGGRGPPFSAFPSLGGGGAGGWGAASRRGSRDDLELTTRGAGRREWESRRWGEREREQEQERQRQQEQEQREQRERQAAMEREPAPEARIDMPGGADRFERKIPPVAAAYPRFREQQEPFRYEPRPSLGTARSDARAGFGNILGDARGRREPRTAGW